MKKTLMLTLAAVMCIAAIVSCKKKIDPDNPDNPDNNVPVASIAVSPDKISLTEGQTQQLTATVKPDNAADKTVVWKSSSEAVATVSSTGMVQAVAEGTATITASSSDGKVSGSCAVTVIKGAPGEIAVTSVVVTPSEAELGVGETLQLEATVLPENATDKTCTWSSSDDDVATVSESGLVSAKAAGETDITLAAGGISATCHITVTEEVSGSHQDVIAQEEFGGSGSAGDDVSGGSGASQGDEESGKNGYSYEYGDNTMAVNESVMEKIGNLTENGFSLPADSQGRSAVGHGDVFVFPPSEQFPGGYAAKVTGVAPDGDGYYYSTTLARIDEVFETLHIEQTGMELGSYVEKVLGEDGREIDYVKTKAGFSLSIPEIFGGLNGLSIDVNDNVSISPSAEINFNMDLAADVVDCKLTYAKAKVNASARLSADVTVKQGVEKEWTSERIKVIMGAIPVGPVIITPELYVSFTLKLTGEVNLTFSVNYQKAYYAYTYYDGRGGVHCKAGEAEIPDKKDPFAVTGNISGGVEFGPNVGFSLSLYAGALGLSVEFDPHMAFAFTGSLPFTMETLANVGRSSIWLANAYTEPSCTFKFGGSVDLAYAWHKSFELPDNVGLSYSFGKTFFMPKLGETLDIKTSTGMAMVTTTIKNKAWFDDNMYVLVHEGGTPDGPLFAKCPFEIPVKPQAEDEEVNCTAFVRGLEAGKRYYVEGPFMTIGAFGYTADVEMSPYHAHADRVIEYVDPKITEAVKGILKDIYAGHKGPWEGCDWDKDYDNPRNYKNVTLYYDLDGIATVGITVDSKWPTDAIIVSDHSSEVMDLMRWNIGIESSVNAEFGRPVVRTFDISDKTFDSGISGSDIICSDRFAVHSPYLTSAAFQFPEGYCPDIDLSGTNVTSVYIYSNVGNIVLDDCPRLKWIEFGGKFYEYDEGSSERIDFEMFDIESVPVGPLPKSISINNCPAFDEVVFSRCRLDGFDKAMATTFVPKIKIYTCVAYELKVPDCCEQFSIRNSDCIFPKLTFSGCARLKRFDDWWQPEVLREYTMEGCPLLEYLEVVAQDKCEVRNCEAMQSLDVEMTNAGAVVRLENLNQLEDVTVTCASTASISMANMPALEYAALRGEYLTGVLPEAVQQLVKRGGSAIYNHKYYYEYGYVDGEWGWKKTTTSDYGFWFPGEPGQHYHYDPDHPND